MFNKLFLLSLFILQLLTMQVSGKFVPISLEDRLAASDLIIEGEIISTISYWNGSRNMIFSEYTLKIYKVFKGEIITSTLTIASPGGLVDDVWIDLCPSTSLNEGDIGIFFLINAGDFVKLDNPIGKYELFASKQGFIQYDLSSGEASCVFDSFKSIERNLIPLIESIAGRKYKELDARQSKITSKRNEFDRVLVGISSFTPSTVNGGAEDTLTIVGTDFGTVRGTVRFRNADNGGSSYITASNSLVALWTDTLIKVRVPSRAGTGTIQVSTNAGDVATSSGSLTVRFALLNSNALYRTYLINDDNSGGYTFTFSQNLFNNQSAVNAFLRAMQTWRCGSYVRFEVSSSESSLICPGGDGINLLSLSNSSCALSAGVLAVTYSYWNSCSGGTVWVLNEADVVLNSQFNWNYGPGAPAFNQYDAESVILHELGHAHQLGHVIGNNYVMHYSAASGVSKRSLNSWSDLAGGEFIMSASTATGRCGRGAMQALNSGNCELSFIPDADFSASLQNGCGSVTVQFTDLSSNNPTQWFWDINNDGVNDYTVQNPQHTYPLPGEYSVRLIAGNSLGRDTIIKSNLIKLNTLPSPGFIGDIIVCSSSNQTYIANLINGYSHRWYVNGGTTNSPVTGSSISVNWGQAGQASIKLVITNDTSSCKDSLTKIVQINPKPQADFIGELSVCTGSRYIYVSNSQSGIINQWFSKRGNIIGQTNSNNLQIEWSNPGIDTITLVQTIVSSGCSDTLSESIVINPLPNPAIDGSLGVCAENIEDYSAPNEQNTSYSWSVVGGHIIGNSNERNVRIKWGTGFNGNLKLVMTNNTNGCKDSIIEIANINPLPKPIISGEINVCSMTEYIYSSNTNPALSHQWYVEGGKIIGSSTSSNVKIVWNDTTFGSLRLVQKVSTSGCKDSTKIFATINKAPIPDISGNFQVCLDEVSYYETSADSIYQYEWSAKNGVIINGNKKDSVGIKWLIKGKGYIKLVKRNISSGCLDSNETSVDVIDFEKSSISGLTDVCQYDTCIYKASNSEKYDYQWELIGGNIIGSNDRDSVLIEWDKAGDGVVILYQSLKSGSCSDSTSRGVNIKYAEKIIFSDIPIICKNDSPINLDFATPKGGVYSGEGIIEGILYPAKLNIGVHTIYYNFNNESGCISNSPVEIEIHPNPERPNIIYINGKLISDFEGINQWYYNGEAIYEANNIEYLPTKSGYYSAVAIDDKGCESLMSDSLFVEYVTVYGDNSNDNSLRLSPIPADNILNVEINISGYRGNIELRIINIFGQELYKANINQEANKVNKIIDISHIQQGFYIIELSTPELLVSNGFIILK